MLLILSHSSSFLPFFYMSTYHGIDFVNLHHQRYWITV